MLPAHRFFRASMDAGRRWWGSAGPCTGALVPIRSLGPSHAPRIGRHLLTLSRHDRYLRFGHAATDEQIGRYVEGLDFHRDQVFGVYNRQLELLAVAHLALAVDLQARRCAEFAVSVLPHARGRGYGARLFDRAVMHARNEGVGRMFVHALSENTAMLRIARKAGATMARDGSQSECDLRLAPADVDSHLTELLHEQIAQTDYQLKAQAHQFWDLLRMVHEVRLGVRQAGDRMPM